MFALHRSLLTLTAALLLSGPLPAQPAASAAADANRVELSVAGQPYPGHYRPATEAVVYGAVLLIGDVGQPAATTGLLNTLGSTLANHHWHTLTVAGNDQPQSLIAAGLDYLTGQQARRIVLLAEGASSALVLQAAAGLSGAERQQIAALMLLNANQRLAPIDANLFTPYRDTGFTIVDAYSGNDLQQQQQARQRQQAADRSGALQYQQIRLPSTSLYQHGHSNRSSQRIRGWLDTQLAGVKRRAQN